MEIKKIFKKIPIDTSVFFTFITALYAILMMIVNVNEKEILMSAKDIVLIFVFSALAGSATAIKKLPSIPKALAVVSHYLIFIIAFYLCFLLPRAMRPAQVFIGIVIFSLLYAIVMALSALIRSRFRTNAEQQGSYQSQFKGAK